MMTYELLALSRLADHGTLSPVPLAFPYPALILPYADVTVCADDQEWRLGKGQCLLLLHHEPGLRLLSPEQSTFDAVYAVSFQSYRLASREPERLLFVADTGQLPEHGRIVSLSRLAEASLRTLLDLGGVGASEARLRLALHELLEDLFSSRLEDHAFFSSDPSIRQAVDYIQARYDTPLSRAQLARLSGFNESYFSSLFRKETGWSFAEYINRIRIDQAKQRLLATEVKLQDIALQIGMSEGSYLGKVFRKTVHLSPSAFRKKRGSTRIIALQFPGTMLALGLHPLAVTKEVFDSSALLRSHLQNTVALKSWDEAETISRLEPELIVAPSYLYNYPDAVKRLELIAPLLIQPWGQLDKQEEVRVWGQLLDRVDEAERWISRLQRKAAAARASLAAQLAPDETVGIYELWYEDSWMIPHLAVRSAYNLFQLLQLKPPQRIQHEVLQPSRHRHVPEREVPAYAADHMFLIVADDDLEACRHKLMQRAVWRRLVEERGCRLHLLRLQEFWLDDGLALELQLDTLVDALRSAT